MKSSLIDRFEEKLMPVAQLISKNKYLVSIRDGFLVNMPLLIIGSIFMLIANFPIQSWIDLLRRVEIKDVSISALLSVATQGTFSLMAIFVAMGVGYYFSKNMNVNAIFGAAVSLVSWFMLMPFTTIINIEGIENPIEVASIPLEWVGSRGIFIGIVTTFLAIHIFKWVTNKGWVVKMPAGVPPTVADSFSALIPISVVIGVFVFIRLVFILTPWDNAFNFIFEFLQLPLQNVGDSLGAMILVYLFAHTLWLFGIHGTNITDTIFRPILLALSAENLTALEAGTAMPHIINQQFQDLFATYGGAGSTLSLLVVMVVKSKSKRIKELGKLSIVPGIFGINEPIIFGLPVVLNPVIAIPFMLVPMINIIVTWVVMNIGLVPISNGVIMPWTTPPIISGFLASGWQGSVLQFIMIIVGAFIYYPFVMAIDKQYLKEEQEATEVNDSEDISFDDLKFED